MGDERDDYQQDDGNYVHYLYGKQFQAIDEQGTLVVQLRSGSDSTVDFDHVPENQGENYQADDKDKPLFCPATTLSFV